MTRSLPLGVLERCSYNGVDTIAVHVDASGLNKQFISPCTIHNPQSTIDNRLSKRGNVCNDGVENLS